MRRYIATSLILIFGISYMMAQDSLLIYKSGAVVNKVALLDFDTLLFYNPTIVYDIDSNVYTMVKIGTQTWMKENLKAIRYNDGKPIPLVTTDTSWYNLTTSGFCWYKNDSTTYFNTYGILYNWFTINTGKLCPVGWHVPLISEWITLYNYLGGTEVGNKLKETGITHWKSPNTGATDSVGFSALPGGVRYNSGSFSKIGQQGYWWSKDEQTASNAKYIYLSFDLTDITWVNSSKNYGMSVRCLRDN